MQRTLIVVALAGLGAGAMGDVIASQNFNGLDDSGAQTFDMLPAGSMLTNSGSSNAGGGGMDFATFWAADTRGVGFGPVTPNNDTSDFIGVNSFAGNNSPDVGPDGTPVGSGIEHNFEFNDGDGRLELVFAPVDLTGFSARTVDLNMWINNTSWESDDFLTIDISGGGGSINLLNWGDTQLDANVSDDDGTANWLSLSFDLEAAIGALGESLTLTIGVDNNSGSENIFADEVSFNGVPAPSSLALLGLGGILASRRRR